MAGECILSQEGTTQGDPLEMPFYALGILPLVRAVATPDTCQLWYADDSSAGGRLVAIRSWWDKLQAEGPSYGYHLNVRKSVLGVKPHAHDDAVRLFADTGIQVTSDGNRYLGSAIGTPDYIHGYIQEKVNEWCKQIETLSSFARTQPQAAYTTFVRALSCRWTFFLSLFIIFILTVAVANKRETVLCVIVSSIRVGAINREKQWLVAAVVWVLHLSKDEEGSISIARAGRRYTLIKILYLGWATARVGACANR